MGETYIWDISSGYSTKIGKYKTELEKDFIYKHLPSKKINVLDIGGGSGRFAIPLSEIGHKVTVVEPNEEALFLLKQRNNTVKCINSNFEEFIAIEKYDVVLIIEVLGDFENIENIFSKVDDLLNPNGLLIISTKNTGSFMNKIKSVLRRKRHAYPGYTTLNSYKGILKKKSFQVEEIKGLNWLPFKVNSNSVLVPLFISLINILSLNNWISQSPELLICAKKR